MTIDENREVRLIRTDTGYRTLNGTHEIVRFSSGKWRIYRANGVFVGVGELLCDVLAMISADLMLGICGVQDA